MKRNLPLKLLSLYHAHASIMFISYVVLHEPSPSIVYSDFTIDLHVQEKSNCTFVFSFQSSTKFVIYNYNKSLIKFIGIKIHNKIRRHLIKNDMYEGCPRKSCTSCVT